MGIEAALDYIHSVKWQGSKPGLERTRELLAALGNPDRELKFVHIAGTNGKGSTAACIAAVLRQAGYRTGLYVSPYILRFNERMQIDGRHISDGELEALTWEIRPYADAMRDAPTEFELITALAMRFFHKNRCDVVVLEVGMGGELDSTNVIPTPEMAVITAIGLDHTAELGPTVEDIAAAKAGIIKPGGDVVVYGGTPGVMRVFEDTCRARGARLHITDFSRLTVRELTLEAAVFDFAPYRNIRLPLVGSYQPNNAAVAITALEGLRAKGYRITDGDISAGLSAVRWPGRFEILRRDPVFVLDGAHNPQGIEATADSLRRHFGDQKIVFLIGVMADKELSGFIGHLAPLARAFFTAEPPNPRAMKARELARALAVCGRPVTPCASVREGVCRAIEAAGAGGVVCALGSLYFSGDIREAVNDTYTD